MGVIATAGHVDHGKSTLVRSMTGTDPDRLAEEKARGLTIDLGFAEMTLPSGARVGVVDVPGHARFIKNMLAGVGSVDAVLFVVAATEGWKPQSEEHLRILEVLGVERGVVALTKVRHRAALELDGLRDEVRAHLAGTFLASAAMVEVDPPAGVGTGPDSPLAHALDAAVSAREAQGQGSRPRLWIDRSFSIRGSGTVVTGTLTGGPLQVGDEVGLEPSHVRARIRGLQNHGRPVETARPGQRIAVNLSGVSPGELHRGDAVVLPGQFHRSSVVDVSLQAFPSLGHPVGRRGAYVAHVGSGEHPVRLRLLGGAGAVAPGTTATARLQLTNALPLLPGDRFVIRDSGRDETVGGGEILDVDPVVPASRARPDRSVARVVRERGWISAEDLERLTGQRVEPVVGRWVVDADALARREAALTETVRHGGYRGIDTAVLDDRDRMVIERLPSIVVERGRATLVEFHETSARHRFYSDHPFVHRLRRQPFRPPSTDGVDRVDLERIAEVGLAVDAGDGVWFAESAVEEAATVVSRLMTDSQDGLSVSTVARTLGTSRRYALPLLAELDRRGVTKRNGAVRIPGPASVPTAAG